MEASGWPPFGGGVMINADQIVIIFDQIIHTFRSNFPVFFASDHFQFRLINNGFGSNRYDLDQIF